MGTGQPDIKQRVVDYVMQHGDDLAFTRFFWKECEPLRRDIENYSKFASIITEDASGIRPIPMKMGVGLGSSHSWAAQDAMPKLGHYLKALLDSVLRQKVGSG